MPVEETVDTEQTEADGTSTETPAGTETITAEGDGKNETGDGQPDKGKTSQSTSSTGESEDGAEPDKGKPVPYKQWTDMRERRDRYRDRVKSFQESGISTPEDAEFLRNEAEQFSTFRSEMETNPVGFFEWYQSEFPKQAQELIEALKPDAVDPAEAVVGELRNYAKAFRKRGGEGDDAAARLLDSLADGHEGKKADEKKPADQKTEQRADDSGERVWNAFAREVTGELDRGFKEAITDLTKDTGFKNDEQKNLFVQTVVREMDRMMSKDAVFVKRREAAQHGRLGHTSQQAQDAAKLYLSWAKAEGRLESVVRKHAETFGLSKKAAPSGKTEQGRREVAAGGLPAGASGKLSADQSAKLKSDIQREGLSGADAMTEYIKRKTKLLGRK